MAFSLENLIMMFMQAQQQGNQQNQTGTQTQKKPQDQTRTRSPAPAAQGQPARNQPDSGLLLRGLLKSLSGGRGFRGRPQRRGVGGING